MQITWNDKEPIYRQLHDRIVELILEGVYTDGDALPSLRQISSEHRINPITISKAFQLLVDEDLVEKRRGLGMFVTEGAGRKLIEMERRNFISKEWPQICGKIARLGLSIDYLLEKCAPKLGEDKQ